MNLAFQSIAAAILVAFCSGCTHMVKVEPKPTEIPVGQKIDRPVALVLSKELTEWKHEMKLMGDKWVYPYGTALADYAKRIANAEFTKVTVAPTPDAAAADAGAALVLIPRGVKAEQSLPVFAWEKMRFTLVVEWTAKDRASQNTVWLKTITAEATETAGNAFTGSKHLRQAMQTVFDDLTLKTHTAFQEAAELKAPK